MNPAELLAATGYNPAAPPTNESVAAMLCAMEDALRAEQANQGTATTADLLQYFRVSRTRLATALQRAKVAPITGGRRPRYDRAATIAALTPYL